MEKGTERKHSMDENKRKYMSEPDENGIRYFDMPPPISGGSGEQALNGGGSGSGNGKKRKTFRNIAIVLAIVLIAALFGGGMTLFSSGDGFDTPYSPYIATLYVEGTIQSGNTDYLGRATGYQHEWTLDAIDMLMSDSENYGLIIFVDSPGGSVYEIDELYLKIKEYQEVTGNPVYSVMGSMAASGGYYISAPCEKIYANRNTWTGSIGVTIGTIVDVSGFLEKYGVKTKTITSGEHKAMGSSYQEMTPEEEAIWRSLIDEAYEQFVGIVAEGRNMEKADVYPVADGRILSAKQAMNAGLVDELGGIDDAFYAMCDEIDEEMYFERTDIVYQENSGGLSWLLGNAPAKNNGSATRSDADTVADLIAGINTHPISYCCEVLNY